MQTLSERPADSAGVILSGLALQQRERETTLQRLRRLRKEASAEIERLIAFLDASDPYASTELEDDISADLEEGGDTEPSLGSFDRISDQTKSYRVNAGWPYPPIDGELDRADNEPGLGSLDCHHSQERWAAGDRRDLEQDLSESGIGDFEGLYEQAGTQDWQQGAMA